MNNKCIPLLLALFGTSLAQGQPYNSYRHADGALKSLIAWGAVSTAAGLGMMIINDPQLTWFGVQNSLWGTIDVGIGIFALHKNNSRLKKGLHPETHRLLFRKLLFVNGLLDIAYIGGGIALLAFGNSDMIRGNGLGVILQGGFLFVFDWMHFTLTYRK